MPTEPFKFVGTLIACEKDEDGNITSEFKAGDLVIYAARFGELDKIVAEAWKLAEEKERGGDV